MAEKRLFGNSIDESIVNELKRREKLLSKGDASNTDILPNDPQNLNSLRYTTQKGAWVRMISSVNIKENENDETGSPEVSKNFILTGGESTSTGVKKEGINFDSFDTTKSYRKTETLGVRPEAGITSFSIKHKGTYGSLRDAEISFNVWSREDLNRAQDIYLRPGVHMIVEWGHTIDSELNPTKLPDVNNYFNIPKKIVDIDTFSNLNRQQQVAAAIAAKSTSETTASKRKRVQDLINKHREENLSYEGFIGLVTNFSWSFREDGGYDCSVKIISTGAVMESLTVIQGAGGVTTQELVDCMKVEDSKEQDDSKKSLMHEFVRGVERASRIFQRFTDRTQSSVDFGSVKFSDKSLVNVFEIQDKQRFSDNLKKILIDQNISLYGFAAAKGKDRVYFRYMTVRDLLKFLNASNLFPNNPNGEKTSTFFIEPESNDKSVYSKYKTFDEHFSLDIKTCILAKPPLSSNKTDSTYLNKIRLPDNVSDEFKKASFKGESNNIQSILVELDFLLESFDSALSSDEEDIYRLNVYSFIKNLLKGINNALGNITDLDFHFDEALQQYKIVDREAVVNKEDLKEVAQLSFTGLSNTVQKVSIQTKITPQLTSQIAISAQGTKSIKEGDNNSSLSMKQWNSGILDRFEGTSNEGPQREDRPSCVEIENTSILSELKSKKTRLEERVSNLKQIIRNSNNLREKGIATQGLPSVQEELKRVISSIQELENKANTPFVLNFLEPWSDAFSELVEGSPKGFWFFKTNSTSYREDLFSKIRRFGISYFRDRYFKSIGGEQNEDKTSDPGLIPIELSITLDGIGGLKIGEVFKLNQVDKFLPDVYKDYGFIITGLDNAIENNKWNTTIRALTFKLPK